jgi:hypothetical protein
LTGKNEIGRNEWLESFFKPIVFFSNGRKNKNEFKLKKLQKCHTTYYTVKPVYNGHPWDLKNVVITQRVD